MGEQSSTSRERTRYPTFNLSAWTGIHRMLAHDVDGQAILEFAISLPLLVVFIVGIYDFSGAFDQKQKIEQAAQEGAIVAGAQPTSDLQATNGNPDSLQPVVTAIFNSLVGSGVITGSCTPSAGTGGPNLKWTFKVTGCPGTLTVIIDRGLETGAGTLNSPASLGTVITVEYPYIWRFNSVIQLLIPGANYAATTLLTEKATVHNQL